MVFGLYFLRGHFRSGPILTGSFFIVRFLNSSIRIDTTVPV